MPEKKAEKSGFFSDMGKNFGDVLKVANRAFINQVPYGREVKTAESVGKRIITRAPVVRHVVSATSTVANNIPIVNRVKSGIASSDPLAKYSTRSSRSPRSTSRSSSPTRKPVRRATRKSSRSSSPSRKPVHPSSPTRKSVRRSSRK